MIAGINLAQTSYGMALRSGGAALMDNDGTLIAAVAEERISREKYAGGFNQALGALIRDAGIAAHEISTVAISSCCDEGGDPRSLEHQFPGARVITVRHHVSHAASAFLASPFEEALVAVCDNEGNATGPMDLRQLAPVHDDVRSFWTAPFERNTYFIGRGNRLTLVAREYDAPLTPGVSEIYHRMTHYIGFGHHDAGKTMGLAPYGRANTFPGVALFSARPDGLGEANLLGGFTAVEAYGLRDWFARCGHDIGPPRSRFDFTDEVAKDLAALVQVQCSQRFLESIRRLCVRHGLRNVCIAGGFGLNCPTNALVRTLPEVDDVFVQPAADDVGQCLGNVLWAYCESASKAAPRRWPDSVYTGPSLSDGQVAQAIDAVADTMWCFELTDERLAEVVADALTFGALVGVCRGRSELGPRALGHRSILADPRSVEIRDGLNRAKGREPWRPLAPIANLETASHYFKLHGPCPHMTFTVTVRPEARLLLRGATHVDGSARVQTVTQQDEPFMHRVIAAFERRTGVACLLNTSLNPAGEPIAETAEEALRASRCMHLDVMVVGRWLAVSKDSRHGKAAIASLITGPGAARTYGDRR